MVSEGESDEWWWEYDDKSDDKIDESSDGRDA